MDEWSCNEVGARAQNSYIVEAIGGKATQNHNIYTERGLLDAVDVVDIAAAA